jgi:putative ATP-dependent endonuclease of OLD family
MYLAQLKISNFRGIKTANIKLTQHFILLGNNNSGKSTIIDAIGLILGKETLVKNIGDWDFFGGNPQPEDRILITGVLTDFDANDELRSKEWFNDISGGIPQWYDSKTGKLFSAAADGLKLAIEIGFAARFDKEELEFETIRYFASGITDPFDEEVNKINRDSVQKKLGKNYFLRLRDI